MMPNEIGAVGDNRFTPLYWYFGFYDRTQDPLRWWGHCDAWGVTKDDTWLFLDPNRTGTHVQVAHIAEEVEYLMALRLAAAREVILYRAPRSLLSVPPLSLHTCASICGSVVGLRAWTPEALKRKLLRNGGEVRHENPSRRSEGESPA
jgi:hypothetical protein